MNDDALKAACVPLVTKHEGRRSRVYLDTKGNPTVGVGLNLNAAGVASMLTRHGISFDDLRVGKITLTDPEIDALLDDCLNTAITEARSLVSGFDSLPLEAQTVIVDMIFNLGAPRFSGFGHFIKAIEVEHWAGAAFEMQHSLWCHEVPNRCTDDRAILLSLVSK